MQDNIQLIEFGPVRVIGMACVGKNAAGEVPALWQNDFGPRMGEIVSPADAGYAVGICRCVPGATDGTFAYIAGVAATADAPVPAGMLEVTLPAATYAAFPVASLEHIMEAWNALGPWAEAHPEWETYCNPTACDCATHPSFELYPAACAGHAFFIYMPVRRKT